MSLQSFPLHWGRGDALTIVQGEVTVEGLTTSEAFVYIEHSAVPLAIAADPVITVTDGPEVIAYVIARAVVNNEARVTDGSGFVLSIRVASGQYSPSDVTIAWTRVGVAA